MLRTRSFESRAIALLIESEKGMKIDKIFKTHEKSKKHIKKAVEKNREFVQAVMNFARAKGYGTWEVEGGLIQVAITWDGGWEGIFLVEGMTLKNLEDGEEFAWTKVKALEEWVIWEWDRHRYLEFFEGYGV